MTTIAWDGKQLAADCCSWSGGARRRVRKVFKLTAPDGQQFLVAFAGNGSFALAVLAWMRGGDRPNPLDFHRPEELNSQCALVIDEKRRIWQLGSALWYSRMYEKGFYAYGGGQDFAWGALEAGATARRAVQIAIKRSDYAGLGVDVVEFD